MHVLHGVIRPIMEYGMEVWGPPPGDPDEQLAPLDDVLEITRRVASGVRAHADEPAWSRRQCVTLPVLLSVLCCVPMNAACDIARFRYEDRLRAALCGMRSGS